MIPVGVLGATAAVALSSMAAAIAQVAADGGGGTLVNITSTGATVSAVGALIYVARLMATGQLVAKSTADSDRRHAEQSQMLIEIQRDLIEMVKDGNRREDRVFALAARGKIEDNR